MQFETNIGVVHGTPRRSSKKPMWEIWALAVFQVNNDKSKIMMSHPLLTLDLLSPKLLPWGKESLPTQGTTGDSWKRVLEIGGRIWRRGAEDRTNCLDPQQAQGAHSFVLHLRYPALDWKIGSGLAGYNSNPSFPASIPTSPRIPSLLSVDSLARFYFSFTLLFCLVSQLCLTLCDPMDCSTPGLPVHHQLPELTQTHVHQVIDAIQPSHPLSSPSPPAFSLSQHQTFFHWVSSPHQVAKVLEFQLQHQSFQWTPRTDCL